MPNLQKLSLDFDADAVLRGQGADPRVIRTRRPALAQLAEKALKEALPLLEPKVIYNEFVVQGVIHDRLILENGEQLKGKLIVEHLAQARKVYILLCTIGSSIEQYASDVWDSSATYSLALEGVGSAAVEALANAACRYFEISAQEQGWQTSIPLSPGMIDWPVEEGQPQIFRLLERENILVELSPSFIMMPRKSLTMVVGAGPALSASGRACEYCNLRDVCRYQDHYQLS
jgi:hypothetical protein